MPFSLADIPFSFIAIILSGLALFLNYRTSRRQGFAEDPLLILTRRNRVIVINNQGRSPAVALSVRTTRGGYISWSNQFNKALRKQDGMGGFVGGEEPWTTDCSGEARTIAPEESECLLLAGDLAPDEDLVLSFENYARRRFRRQHLISKISSP